MRTADPLGSRSSLAWSRWASRLIGIFILIVLVRHLDLQTIIGLLGDLQLGWFLGAVILSVPLFLVKSWRWRMILRGLGIDVPSKIALQMYGAGLFAGQMTPGQLGEIARAHFLWQRGHDGVLATGSVVLDRALDLVLLVGVALPGIVLVLGRGHAVLVVAVSVGVIAGLCLLRPLHWWVALSKWLHRWPLARQVLTRLDESLSTLAQALTTPGAGWEVASATVLALAINITRFYFLMLSLGIALPVGSLVFGVALANLVGLLPITVAGVGLRDTVLVLIFQQAGQPVEGAIAFSVLILLVAYGLNLIWGFPAWLLETK